MLERWLIVSVLCAVGCAAPAAWSLASHTGETKKAHPSAGGSIVHVD